MAETIRRPAGISPRAVAVPRKGGVMFVHDSNKLFREEMESKENVTKADFDKRNAAPARIDQLEGQVAQMKEMLLEIASRLPKKPKPEMPENA